MSQIQVTGEAKIRDIQGPVVANSGVITALDGAASQYVRGDGTLADFPTSTGGGSSVSYYLNSSVSQGTIGGVAYRELSKEPIIGTGTDITITANGYIASYITDANDPALLEVPGGNFNCELYFSVNSNTHNPYVYAELYKYDGTTFTLLGSSVAVPEYLTNGTTLSPYYFAIPVATAALTITDRLAIRIYANVDTREVTLHTENSHLCQVVTTFSKGLTALNNLTKQVQYLATGTSGTNFNIVSSGDTHTFNLPVASATNTGKLSSTDWSTFNAKQPAGNYVTLDTTQTITAEKTFTQNLALDGNGSNAGTLLLKNNTISPVAIGYASINSNGNNINLTAFVSATKTASFDLSGISDNIPRTFTFPNASGTLALTSNLSSYVPYTGATGSVNLGLNNLTANNVFGETSLNVKILPSGSVFSTGYSVLSSLAGKFTMAQEATAGNLKAFTFDFSAWATNTSRTYSLPDITGTLALLEGTQTFTGDKLFNGSVDFNNSVNINSGLFIRNNVIGSTLYTSFTITKASSTQTLSYLFSTGFASNLLFNDAANYSYTFPAASGTLALTSDIPSLTGYVPYTGATTNVNIGNNNYLGGSILLNQSAGSTSATGYLSLSGSTGAGTGAIVIGLGSGTSASMSFPTSSNYSYIFPATSGTLALTSDLSAYLPLNGGTLTGALSGTSATFTANTNGVVLNAATGTTNTQFKVANTSGDNYFGVAASDGSSLFTGTTAYSAYLGTNNARSLHLVTNGIVRQTIASTGAATFSSSVTAGAILSTGVSTFSRTGLVFTLNPSYGGADVYTQLQSTGALALASGGDNNRLYITSGGKVMVGTTDSGPNALLFASRDMNGPYPLGAKGESTNQGLIGFFDNGNSVIGSVSKSGSSVAYNTSSDYRLKQDLKDYSGLSLISAIKTYDYEWKAEKTRAFGVIAHELAEVIPYAVFGEKDAEQMQGVDYSKIVPVNTKAIQELYQLVLAQDAKIEELKALINK